MYTQLFLVRHADYEEGSDPHLSDTGRQQSLRLAEKIKAGFNGIPENITIWSSSANRAKGTAEIIKQEMQLAKMVIEEKLWSDNRHPDDFNWLLEKLKAFEGDVLIIVSHLEYVRYFPRILNFPSNNAGYAEGVKIQNGICTDFSWK
ncbi:MAG: histidine phosphatase family protein [Candidatus Pacebacteria bacterium]|nr:histidine phosphatase family protein [Candidatus Paceibacterota bacterium]